MSDVVIQQMKAFCSSRGETLGQKMTGEDWVILQQLCRTHGLPGWILSQCREEMPEDVRGVLEQRRDKARVRGLLLERGARAVQSIFRDAGIVDVAPLKGTYLLPRVYEDYGARTTNDVDLLVRKNDFDACHECLLEHGYLYVAKPSGRPVSQRLNYERSYRAPDGTMIDLHWAMAQETRVHDCYDELWESSSVIPSGSLKGFREFTPEDVFLLLCIHIGQDNFQGPFRQWVDLIACHTHWNIDYSQVFSTAGLYGAETVVWCVLMRLRVLGVLQPDCMDLESAGPTGPQRMYLERLMNGGGLTPLHFSLHNRLAQLLVALPAMDAWSQRGNVVWEQLYLRIRDSLSRADWAPDKD